MVLLWEWNFNRTFTVQIFDLEFCTAFVPTFVPSVTYLFSYIYIYYFIYSTKGTKNIRLDKQTHTNFILKQGIGISCSQYKTLISLKHIGKEYILIDIQLITNWVVFKIVQFPLRELIHRKE